MPQIAQQDYKIIAPKEGRSLKNDASALAELKKSVLNGIAFDCLLKDDVLAEEGTLDRVLGVYGDGSLVYAWDSGNDGYVAIDIPYTVTQYQGLSAVQEAMDEEDDLQSIMPTLEISGGYLLASADDNMFVCVDGKYLTVTGDVIIEALAIAETGPSNAFVNISWEDAQKLIRLPLV